MVILEKGKYIIHIPEIGLWQDMNPDNRQMPFKSEAEARAWETAYLARNEDARQAYEASLAIEQEAAAVIEAAREAAIETIDIFKLADADFKRLVLTALGYKVKEV